MLHTRTRTFCEYIFSVLGPGVCPPLPPGCYKCAYFVRVGPNQSPRGRRAVATPHQIHFMSAIVRTLCFLNFLLFAVTRTTVTD